MRFTALQIHAFGRLAGESLELADGLNVIVGGNEAGKTTLKQFVETMLYGFKPAGDSHPYWPWTPSPHAFGGELSYVLDTEGRFRVRRHLELRGRKAHEVCDVREGLDGDGPRASFEAVALAAEHIGHRREIWRNVFAIDLAALVDVSALDRADRVGLEQVFFRDLCALGTIANPKTVLGELTEALAQLKLLPGTGRRKKGEIDLFVGSELASAKTAVRDARDRQRRVRELRSDVADLETERRAILKTRAEVNAQIEVLTQRMPLVELYREWMEAQRDLSQAGEHRFDESVAAAVTVEAARLSETRGRLEHEEAILRKEDGRLAALTASVAADDAVLEHGDEIDTLSRQAESVAVAMRAWRDADRTCQNQARAIQKSLAVVCRVTNLEQSPLLNLTPEATDSVLQLIERWRALDARITDVEQQRRTLVEQVRQVTETVESLRQRMPDDLPADYRPSQLREADDVSRCLDRVEAEEKRVAELQERTRDEDSRLRLIRRQVADSSGKTTAAAPTGWIITGSIALLLGLAAAAFYFSQGQASTAIWPSALGLTGGGVVGYAFWRRRRAMLAEDLAEHSELLQGQLVRIEGLRHKLESASTDLADARATAEAGWRGLGMQGEPHRLSLSKRLAELRRFDDSRQDFAAHEAAAREQSHLRLRVEAEERRHETLRRERHELVSRLCEQAKALGLLWDEATPADRARQVIASAGRLVAEWRNLATERTRLDAQQEGYETFNARCQALASALGQDAGDGDARAERVLAWKRTLDEARERLGERKRLDAEADARRLRLAQLHASAEGLQERVTAGCERLGIERVDDVERARSRARRIDGLRQRVDTLRDAFSRQRRNAGLPDSWEPGDDASTTGGIDVEMPDSGADRVSHAELVARREEIDAQVETLNRRAAQIRALIDELSAGPSIAMAEGALESARDKYVAMCSRYDAILVAHRMLDAALKEFQRERQPQIVARAQKYLERLSAGARRRLEADLLADSTAGRADAKSPPLHLVSETGQAHPIDLFSRGTREQAYLALRMALAAELSVEERLPLILDDVLVNFDDERAAAAARLIADVAAERQVIFLTCHQQTRDLLRKHEANVLTLSSRGDRPAAKPKSVRTKS